MGTRSTTSFFSNGKHLMSIYKQYDGYPKGWGQELKEFIKSGNFVNGFSVSSSRNSKQFNGFGCFVLQLITEYKTGVGGLYLTEKNDEQEYNYEIDFVEKYEEDLLKQEINISCKEDEKFNETIILEVKK